MTDIWTKAWWCKYCAHCDGKHCAKDVPYYGSSPHCDYFEEPAEPKRLVKHTLKWYKKHVLVETI